MKRMACVALVGALLAGCAQDSTVRDELMRQEVLSPACRAMAEDPLVYVTDGQPVGFDELLFSYDDILYVDARTEGGALSGGDWTFTVWAGIVSATPLYVSLNDLPGVASFDVPREWDYSIRLAPGPDVVGNVVFTVACDPSLLPPPPEVRPLGLVEELIVWVESTEMSRRVRKPFIQLLERAQESEEADDPGAAAGQVRAFINMVRAQAGRKIAREDAEFLIGEAEEVRDALLETR